MSPTGCATMSGDATPSTPRLDGPRATAPTNGTRSGLVAVAMFQCLGSRGGDVVGDVAEEHVPLAPGPDQRLVLHARRPARSGSGCAAASTPPGGRHAGSPTTHSWSAPTAEVADFVLRRRHDRGRQRPARPRPRRRATAGSGDHGGNGQGRRPARSDAHRCPPPDHQSRSDADPGSSEERHVVPGTQHRGRTRRRHRAREARRGRARPCAPRARRRGRSGARRSAGMVAVSARRGTASMSGKCPSWTCWSRQARSSSTTFMSRGSSKSATGGSLKARCPFSPMPRQQRSSGWSQQELGVAPALGIGVGQPVDVVGCGGDGRGH